MDVSGRLIAERLRRVVATARGHLIDDTASTMPLLILVAIIVAIAHVALAHIAIANINRIDAAADLFILGSGAGLTILLVQRLIVNQRRLIDARNQLAVTEERWRLAFEAVGDGVWDWNAVNNEVFYSRSWKSMLGFAENEVGNRLEEWDRRVHPDDKADVYADLNRHFSGTSAIYSNEHRVLCKNGKYKWILDRGVVVSRKDDGSPMRVIGTHTDVSRRRSVEDRLKATLAHLEVVLASTPVGIAIVGSDRRIKRVNHCLARMFGHDQDFLIGNSTRIFYRSNEEFDAVGKTHYPVVYDGGIAEIELQLRRADGTDYWVKAVGQMVSKSDPSYGTVWVYEDISQRKAAAEALAASNAFQRLLIDTVPIPIFMKDLDGRYLDVNVAFERAVHMDRAAIRGKFARDLIATITADTVDRADKSLLEAGGSQVYQTVVQFADGTTREVEFSKAVFCDGNGNTAGIVGAIVDISAHKQAERALKEREDLFHQIFDSSVAIKLLIDPCDGRIIAANRAASVFYGWTIAELGAMRITEINTRPIAEVKSDMSRAHAGQCQYFLFRHRLKSSEIRDVEVYTSPIVVNGRNLLLSLIHDITERRRFEAAVTEKTAALERSNAELKQLADQLRVANAAAEAANKAKSEFLAVISHEIRTPLNGILGLARLLLDGQLGADHRDKVELINDSGEGLLAIVNDILDFSKLEAGRVELELIAFPVRRVVASTTALLESRAREKGLTLGFEVADDVPAVLVGDSGRLRQILLNLIGNAVKFTNAGWVMVSVAVAGRTDADVSLRFEVTDTGIGIAKDAQCRLFHSFAQADPSIARRFGGTGLGLAICNRIIQVMGGRIGIQSTPGVGTQLWFEVPLGLAVRQESKADRDSPPDPPAETGTPLTILLVEDNTVNQKVAKELLERRGHQVVAVADGATAFEVVQSRRFDVVLMDVMMPIMDGFAATRAIRTLKGEVGRIPIIGLTASSMEGDDERCRAAGMDHYLSKPIVPDLLFSALTRAGGRRPPPPPAAGIDPTGLQALAESVGAEAIVRLLAAVRDDAPVRSRMIVAALHQGNVAAAQREAHALKSMAMSFGMHSLAGVTELIEHACRRGDHDLAIAAIPDLEHRLTEAMAALPT